MRRPITETRSSSNFKAASLENVCWHLFPQGETVHPSRGFEFKALGRNGWQTEKFEVKVQSRSSVKSYSSWVWTPSQGLDLISGSGMRVSSGCCLTRLLPVIPQQRSVIPWPAHVFYDPAWGISLPSWTLLPPRCLSTAGNHPQLPPHDPHQHHNVITAKIEIFFDFHMC